MPEVASGLHEALIKSLAPACFTAALKVALFLDTLENMIFFMQDFIKCPFFVLQKETLHVSFFVLPATISEP